MHDARNPAPELRLDRDDKALAAHGDQLVLRSTGIGHGAQLAPKRLLDRLMLALRGATDTRKLGRRFIAERTVRLNLSAHQLQQPIEVRRNHRRGKRSHGRPLARKTLRRLGNQLLPIADVLGELGNAPDLQRFQRRAGNSRLVQQGARIEQAAEAELAAHRQVAAHLFRKLLLLLNHAQVAERLKPHNASPAQWGLRAACDRLAQALPFQRQRARLPHPCGFVVSRDHQGIRRQLRESRCAAASPAVTRRNSNRISVASRNGLRRVAQR